MENYFRTQNNICATYCGKSHSPLTFERVQREFPYWHEDEFAERMIFSFVLHTYIPIFLCTYIYYFIQITAMNRSSFETSFKQDKQ